MSSCLKNSPSFSEGSIQSNSRLPSSENMRWVFRAFLAGDSVYRRFMIWKWCWRGLIIINAPWIGWNRPSIYGSRLLPSSSFRFWKKAFWRGEGCFLKKSARYSLKAVLLTILIFWTIGLLDWVNSGCINCAPWPRGSYWAVWHSSYLQPTMGL